MCPLAPLQPAGLWFPPLSEISLRYSATRVGIGLVSAMAPPAGHAVAASGTACSSHTTGKKSKERAVGQRGERGRHGVRTEERGGMGSEKRVKRNYI